jgi:hypothetical protein
MMLKKTGLAMKNTRASPAASIIGDETTDDNIDNMMIRGVVMEESPVIGA